MGFCNHLHGITPCKSGSGGSLWEHQGGKTFSTGRKLFARTGLPGKEARSGKCGTVSIGKKRRENQSEESLKISRQDAKTIAKVAR